MKRLGAVMVIAFSLSVVCVAQIPSPTPPEMPEKILTEEIVLNVTAVDRSGKFVSDVKKEDIVISEDGRLHQANSVRFVPASVLIAMDMGGEIRQKKNITTTRAIAQTLVAGLKGGTAIALMQFHDKVEFLSAWSTDTTELMKIIGSRTSFGRRASFSSAAASAADFFQKSPRENRHLILITDGLDSVEDKSVRSESIRRLWQSGIVVHVISYTQIEYQAFKPQARIWREGDYDPKRMPDQVLASLAHSLPVRRLIAEEILKQVYQPRLFSILIDIPFLKSRREHLKALGTSQVQLSTLAAYTGGEFVLPDQLSEIVDQAERVSQSINSQYVVTYSPKRPLKETLVDEIREVSVSSKRPDLDLRASRRLVVFAAEEKK